MHSEFSRAGWHHATIDTPESSFHTMDFKEALTKEGFDNFPSRWLGGSGGFNVEAFPKLKDSAAKHAYAVVVNTWGSYDVILVHDFPSLMELFIKLEPLATCAMKTDDYQDALARESASLRAGGK